MYQKAISTYYFLATLVLAAGFFVMQPTHIPQMVSMQQDIKQQINIAWEQTIGDQPWFEDVQFVFDTVESFYTQAADTTIAMIQDRESDADIAYVFGRTFHDVASAFNRSSVEPKVAGASVEENPIVPANFMKEEPIYNLVPEMKQAPVVSTSQESVGEIIKPTDSTPVNSTSNPWVTLQDNSTGQLYCVAMYNGTVNQYLGSCKSGYQ